jgi:hypothetical protein
MPHDPLPSWNGGPNKHAILAFVAAVIVGSGNSFQRPFGPAVAPNPESRMVRAAWGAAFRRA